MNKTIKKILYTGLILNILLTIIKLIFGILGNSFSLAVDGINSSIDIIISGLLLISLNIASKESDADHPYGHEKYEAVISLILGVFLIITSIIIVASSIMNFESSSVIEPYTIIVSSISLLLKGIILIISIIGYKKYHQYSLKAETYNHLGDVLATSASLIGIIIAIYTPFKYFDYLAAILISFLIFYNGVKIIKESTSMLVDESPSKEFNKAVRILIKNIPGVIKIDDYKSRLHVNNAYIDVEISVDKNLSLIKAHEIAEEVHKKVEKNFKEVIHCMVHVNPGEKK